MDGQQTTRVHYPQSTGKYLPSQLLQITLVVDLRELYHQFEARARESKASQIAPTDVLFNFLLEPSYGIVPGHPHCKIKIISDHLPASGRFPTNSNSLKFSTGWWCCAKNSWSFDPNSTPTSQRDTEYSICPRYQIIIAYGARPLLDSIRAQMHHNPLRSLHCTQYNRAKAKNL